MLLLFFLFHAVSVSMCVFVCMYVCMFVCIHVGLLCFLVYCGFIDSVKKMQEENYI